MQLIYRNFTILMAKESYIKHLEHIQLMAEISMTMLQESLDAYVEKDLKKSGSGNKT